MCALRQLMLVVHGDAENCQGVCLDRRPFAKQKHPVKATRRTYTSDTRNHYEHRSAPRTQRRDIPGESAEEVQTTAAGAARFVEFYLGRTRITDFRDRGSGYDVHASYGF